MTNLRHETDVRRRRQGGNTLVELALVCAVALPFITGVFQFGYGLFSYNRLVAGVRAGARYASLAKYDSSTATPSTAFADAVRNIVVYGETSVGTQPLVPGLTTSNVKITVNMVGGTPDSITVAISSYTLNTIFKKFQFVNKPAATFRYSGLFAPV